MQIHRWALTAASVAVCTACASTSASAMWAAMSDQEMSYHADVIVVGSGIAGLSAALEAAHQGASVLVVEANSVGGGHAVKAGGFALVNTKLQRSKGINDSPDLAWQDMQRWGEDADPYWTRRYAEESAGQVYDWLTGMGHRPAGFDRTSRQRTTFWGPIWLILAPQGI